MRKHPEVIVERAEGTTETANWDRNIARIAGPIYFLMLLVIGLDVRFGWSGELPFAVHLASAAFALLGNVIVAWAMITNAFFSAAVRVQYDRGHVVVTNGPYSIIRHPGYFGFVIMHLPLPLMLGSLWGVIPAALLAISILVRTALEDRTLREELDGYEAYSQEVRYRLMPGIW